MKALALSKVASKSSFCFTRTYYSEWHMTLSVFLPVIVICNLLYEVLGLLLTFHTKFVYKIVLRHFHVSSAQGRKVLS